MVNRYSETKEGEKRSMDYLWLQKIQDYFCEILNVFLYCVDEKGRTITTMSGREEDLEKVKKILQEVDAFSILDRVRLSSLEEQLVEDTAYGNIKIGAVSIRKKKIPVVNWFVCGITADIQTFGGKNEATRHIYSRVTWKQFEKTLDLLRFVSEKYIEEKKEKEPIEEPVKEREEGWEDKDSLIRREAVFSIWNLVKRQEPAEKLIEEMLSILGKASKVTDIFWMELRQEGMGDCIAQWSQREGEKLFLEKGNEMPAFLRQQLPLIVGTGEGLSQELKSSLSHYNIKSMVVIPLKKEEGTDSFLCFAYWEKEHTWDVKEVRFFQDMGRLLLVLFSILTEKEKFYYRFRQGEERRDLEGIEKYSLSFQPVLGWKKEEIFCVGAEVYVKGDLQNEWLSAAQYVGGNYLLWKEILTKACMECRKWNESGKPYYKMYVSLPALVLEKSSFSQDLKEVLRTTEVNPPNIVLEIEERVVFGHREKMREVLGEVRNLKVRIGMMDFGKEIAPFSAILQFPFKTVKLSPKVMGEKDAESYKETFLKAIAQVTKELEVSLCITGVETKEQLEEMKNIGADFVQGTVTGGFMDSIDFINEYIREEREEDEGINKRIR